jgi:DNA-binding CsgD family transcriptional regulator
MSANLSSEIGSTGFPVALRFFDTLKPVSAQTPEWLKALLNNVGFGIAIFDDQLEASFVNDSAKQALGVAGIANVLAGSRHSRFKPETGIAVSATTGATSDLFWKAASSAILGHRKLIVLGSGKSQIAVAFAPIHLNDAATRIGVLVTTERRTVCEPISLWSYGRALGLTNGEIRVLEQLANGAEPKTAADKLSISLTTVRTHIKAILLKSDSPSIRDFLLRISRLPPIQTMHWPTPSN